MRSAPALRVLAVAVALQTALGFLPRRLQGSSSSSVLRAYKKEVPPSVHGSTTQTSSLSAMNQPSLLPLEPTDPKLFTGTCVVRCVWVCNFPGPLFSLTPCHVHTGRWEIKTTNEPSKELGGFVEVEITEDGTFKALGRRKNDEGLLSSTVQVSRNGSFSLLGLADQADEPLVDKGVLTEAAAKAAAASSFPASSRSSSSKGETPAADGDKVLGILTFQADETEHLSTSVGGVGLPSSMMKGRTAVRDLSGKQRVVHVKVVDLDTIILLFTEQSKFYVLVRSTASAHSADATPATPINVVLVTQLVSLVASAVAEGLRADLLHLFK